MYRLNDLLHSTVCVRPNGIAVSDQEFVAHVSSAVGLAQEMGDRVALCFDDSYLFSVALFSCLSSKKQVVILPNNKPETLKRFNQEFDSVFTEEAFLKLESVEPLEIQIPKNASMTYFTSGSSGVPKKISKCFENLYCEVIELEKTFGSEQKIDLFVATVTHQHIYGSLFKILWPIVAGRAFYSQTIEYPEGLYFISQNFALVTTPAFLKRFYTDRKIKNCMAVFSSGGLLGWDAARTTIEYFGVSPIEVYGSTESGGVAYRKRVTEEQKWTPFSCVEFSVSSEGELSIKSPYFNEPKLLMGDRVEPFEDGFHLVERWDDVVKVEEKRISLLEINSKVVESEFVQESVTVALEDSGRQQTASLIVLSHRGKEVLEQFGESYVVKELRNHLVQYFEAIVVPRKFRFVASLPYNSQSKLPKAEVERYFL